MKKAVYKKPAAKMPPKTKVPAEKPETKERKSVKASEGTRIIGLDFGTCKTMAAWVNPKTGQHELIRLGDGKDYIPTTVYVDDSGEMLFGEAADDEAAMHPERYCRGFKLQLGREKPVLTLRDAGTLRSYSARQLAVAFLRHVKTLCEETAVYGQADAAVITRPVNFSPAQVEDLRLAAEDAGFKEISFITEPEAAGYAFCRLSPDAAFQNRALVVDWGGGTLDMAVVERDGDKVRTNRQYTDGDGTMGGEVFDADLWRFVCTRVQELGTDTRSVQHKAKVQVRKAKEILSRREKRNLSLATSSAPVSVPLTRAGFEKLIEAHVDKAVEVACGLVERVSKASSAPEMLLLVGGSSLVPLVKRRMAEGTRLRVLDWQYTREAVAIGAALWNAFRSAEYLHKMADERNEREAQYELSLLYATGQRGVEQDEGRAMDYLWKSAEQGYMYAQLELGNRLKEGRGVECNWDRAEQQYRLAADQGLLEAYVKLAEMGKSDSMYTLGLFYLNGDKGLPKSVKEARRWLRRAAAGEPGCREAVEMLAGDEIGDALSQFQLGDVFYAEKDNPDKAERAFYWYSKSAGQNHHWGLWNLAKCYREGCGCEVDVEKARELFRKSADFGNAYAVEELAKMNDAEGLYRLGYSQYNGIPGGGGAGADCDACGRLCDAANRGHSAAAYYVGKCRWHSECSHKNQVESAKERYNVAASRANVSALWQLAELGDHQAECRMGLLYLYGDLPHPEKDTQAYDWFRKSGAGNDSWGAYYAGLCSRRGWGRDTDNETAVYWFKKAAAAGQSYNVCADRQLLEMNVPGASDSLMRLGELYANGILPHAEADKEAYRCFEKAASFGNPWGCYYAGKFALDGRACAKDEQKAREWFAKAASLGSTCAVIRLAELGDAASQCELGKLYYYDDLPGGNREAARHWFDSAAEQGYPEGQFFAGICRLDSRCPELADEENGVAWLRKAAAQGFARALNLLWEHHDPSVKAQYNACSHQQDLYYEDPDGS